MDGWKKRNRLKESSSRRRKLIVAGGLATCFIAAIATQAKTQLFNRSEIIELAIRNGHYEINKTDMPKRGTIYSADGQVLAETYGVYAFSLFYDRLPKSPGFYADLALASGISMAELRQPGLNGAKSRHWGTRISYEQAKAIEQVQDDWVADGISLAPIKDRTYPLGMAAAGITGLIRDGKSRAGLELGLDDVMEGSMGKAKVFIDSSGTYLPIRGEEIIEAVQGQDVLTTINSSLQMDAYQAIAAAVQKFDAKRGCAIVMDCSNGDILAMANAPTYDPNKGILKGTDLNMAYMGRYQPGSTFKTLTVAKAIESGAVNWNATYQCTGSIRVSNRTISCSHGSHGLLGLEGIISESCNAGAAHLALEVGHEGMEKLIKNSGLLDPVDLHMPNGITGYIHDDPAERLQCSNWGFGQAMVVPPVALARAFSALGNKGIPVEPRLIAQIGQQDQDAKFRPRIMEAATAEKVLDFMVTTFTDPKGTANNLQIPRYRLSGKTGTGQKLGVPGGGYMSNFLAFVPSGDKNYLILVMVDDPKKGSYYGSTVAGPAMREIALSLIRNKRIAPTREKSANGSAEST